MRQKGTAEMQNEDKPKGDSNDNRETKEPRKKLKTTAKRQKNNSYRDIKPQRHKTNANTQKEQKHRQRHKTNTKRCIKSLNRPKTTTKKKRHNYKWQTHCLWPFYVSFSLGVLYRGRGALLVHAQGHIV